MYSRCSLRVGLVPNVRVTALVRKHFMSVKGLILQPNDTHGQVTLDASSKHPIYAHWHIPEPLQSFDT